ncbi:hypothetical protein A2U01_0063756, partial [Trifolium medium]|nr:hypothetical protein [Trifolium medium]
MEITLEEAYKSFLKEIEELHEKELRKKLPPDPGKFTVPCSIQGVNIKEALLDLGSSINLMPLALAEKYNIGK